MNITIRGVDEKVFREFKEETVRKGLNLENPVTNAMRTWLGNERAEKKG